ncbi:MAG: SDR family oxidoreductase [Actinomycetota bacterium]|nr:SDR family oxidoreductase [Actinomycetota bacterium]
MSRDVAVVTGAGSGIGRALSIALTRRGVHVAASDVDPNGLAETAAACGPATTTTYQVDVGDRDGMLAHAEQVRDELGAASWVFNNAGVDLVASVADMSWADLDWLLRINVGGVLNGTKAFLPHLIESGSAARPARLVNLSSAFGLIAVPYQSAYNTSKFAVRGFTEALRQEMIIENRPVTVHCVHPGVVRTNFAVNMRTDDTVSDRDQTVRMFQRAAMTSPEKAAEVILRGVDRNRARILIGPDGRVMAAAPRVLGAAYVNLLARAARLAGAQDRLGGS